MPFGDKNALTVGISFANIQREVKILCETRDKSLHYTQGGDAIGRDEQVEFTCCRKVPTGQ